MAERPLGRRFSHVYLERGDPVEDSEVIRNRISEFFYARFIGRAEDILEHLLAEIGLPIPGRLEASRVRDFLKAAPVYAFFDACTEISQFLLQSREYSRQREASDWIAFLQRVFTEENSRFEVDAEGGIHPRVDAAFRDLEVAAVRDLEKPRYATALAHFEEALAAFDEQLAGTGRAIREMHLAVEDVFKLVCPNASRLEPNSIDKDLKPLIARRLSGPELAATNLMLKGFGLVASAAHQYRHAQGAQAAPASVELAVAMMTNGIAFLRWLIAFDQAEQSGTRA